MIVVNIVLDLACFKYRKLAHLFIYIESAAYLIMSLIPASTFVDMHIFVMSMMYLIIFISLYCDSRAQIIVITVCFVVQAFVIYTLGYLKGTSTIELAATTLSCLIYWLTCSAIGILITYIKELHNTLNSAN